LAQASAAASSAALSIARLAMSLITRDFTLSRFRAKLASKYLLHPDVEPDYTEVYRPDLNRTAVVRRQMSLGATHKASEDKFARTTGTLYNPPRNSMSSTGTFLTNLETISPSDTRGSQFRGVGGHRLHSRSVPFRRQRSVPALGMRTMDCPPASLQLLQLNPAKSTSTCSRPASPASPDSEKDKLAVIESKRLWTMSCGSEATIVAELAKIKEEDPEAPQASVLQRISRAPVVGMQVPMKAGARIDWPNPEWDGGTLLLKAIRTDCLPLAIYCLSLGADPAATDNSGRGILHWCAIEGNAEITGYFIENYPTLPVNAPDSGGDTPLHLAAYHGHLTVVRQLVCAGADPDAASASGFTPYDLAEARRAWHVGRYLLQSRDLDEDVVLKGGGKQLRDFMRPCNLVRASEVRGAAGA